MVSKAQHDVQDIAYDSFLSQCAFNLAGTSFCGHLGKALRHPSFACMVVRPEDNVGEDYPNQYPWTHNATGATIHAVKQYFDLISWEFKSAPGGKTPRVRAKMC